MPEGRPLLVCLLPVRNGAADLPGFFASARRFADAIVALDDGSTDETYDLLRAEPLVVRVLRNPTRPDFRGWHDAANRNLLLEAAAELAPEWIMSVDADERIDEADAVALRDFLQRDALPGVGYGFRCFSVTPDLASALPNPIWVYRMFAFEPGARFPDQALHFAPIPAGIPRRALIRTTIRIQHLGGSSTERRRARYEKYRQADPDCRFWPDYASLLDEPDPARFRPWTPRPLDEPIIFQGVGSGELESPAGAQADQSVPTLSIVVCADPATPAGRRALDSARTESAGRHVEVVLVTTRLVEAAGADKVVPVPSGCSAGAARNAGLRAASGRRVVFIDDRHVLEPGAVKAVLAAHDMGYALVTAPVVDGGDGAIDRASYLSRYGADQPGAMPGVLDGPVRWASYDRQLLLDQHGFDETGNEGFAVRLHRDLAWHGYLAYRVERPILRFRDDASAPGVLAEAVLQGRATGRYFLRAYADRGELLTRRFLEQRLVRSLPRRVRIAHRRADRAGAPGAARALAVAAEVGGIAGEWATLAAPGRGKGLVLLGRPAGIALLAVRWNRRSPLLALARFDLRARVLRVVVLEPDLRVPGDSSDGVPLAAALGVTGGTGAPAIARFDAQDALGRWLQLEIDEIIGIDGDRLPAAFGEGAGVAGILSWLRRPRTLLALLAPGDRAPIVRSSLRRLPTLLGLLRLRRCEAGDIALLSVGRPGAPLDADDIALMAAALDAGALRRPHTEREALKRVEWA